MKRACQILRTAVERIDQFDPRQIQAQHSPQVNSLRVAIASALERAFGAGTVEFNRFERAASFDDGPYNYAYDVAPSEFQATLAREKELSQSLLRQAISDLEEELRFQEVEAPPSAVQKQVPLLGCHREIIGGCTTLFEAGAYDEAVAKGFRIVRDRLRTLTGHEKGSDAFGQGKLHILGAAAANVDADFNSGAKFLFMSIDMFRNEKSHTADGNIETPVQAIRYLMMTSLALDFLDRAEIRRET